ncbi:hypothetical protein [Clostridium sp. AM58-1XD]|uniref:hypothetical protein n=1 Tax=Clostridium sp. AM58-1XD TaxID=2292307 RepID=UPI000E4667C8|nr:hypothetical protein [Clostridium sp. AM58-1XD]RGY96004.1 hypothetical protein DXA13_18050 [Clostridium sp. AM58-1XD]
MKELLDEVRKPVKVPVSGRIIQILLAIAAGILLGLTAKILDETASNRLPLVLQSLDLRNFFSRIGFWMFCGICISVYSSGPCQAAGGILGFFSGMVGSYYAYTILVAGFYPRSYMMTWIAMTALSPLMGMICWYARGTHILSVCISSIIIMMMTRQAFAFGFWYLDIRDGLELILWIMTIAVLYRSPKQIMTAAGTGILLFFLTSGMNLFWGML